MEEKTELKVFKESYVGKLFREAQDTGLANYQRGSFPYEEQFPKGGTGLYLNLDFTLDSNESDFYNSKNLYEALKDMNEVQASDERLWVYLTHVTFWNYMLERWPVADSIGRMRDRYFLRRKNIETLTRNGISRLWWYAHLTYDPNRENPYELTEVLLKRADLSVSVIERTLGSNPNIRFAVLEFLKENSTIANDEKKTRDLMKGLNLAGGVRNLPYLEIDEIKVVLEQIKSTL